MLACARLGAVHSVVFGGFAAAGAGRADRRRPAEGGRLAPRAASRRSRVVEYKPLLDAALELADAPPEHCVVLQRAAGARPSWRRAATSTGPRRVAARRAGRLRAGRRPPTRSTSSTPRAPPGGPRASCATTAATPSRCGGAWRTSTTSARARCSGRPPTSAGSSATRYIVYAPLLHGLHHGALRGQAGRHARRRGVLAGDRRARRARRCSPRRPRSGRSRRRTRTGELRPHATTCPRLRALFLAGERLDPDTYHWASDLLGVPVIDHWWQTETGWPIAANCVGIEPLPVKPGSPTGRCPATDVRILDADGDAGAAGAERARSRSGCRCRRARCPRCGTTTSASWRPTCRPTPATT